MTIEMLINILYPGSLIMLLFTVFWIISFKEEYFQLLFFKNKEKNDLLYSVVMWIWLIGSIFAICETIDKIKL